MGRVVSVDYGLARLGIAISDENQIIVSKSFVMPAEKKSASTAAKLLETLKPYTFDKIIVGLPLHLDGKKGFLADETLYFISCLKELLPNIPVISFDERLSTKMAERMLKEEAHLRRKKRASIVDAISACIILENYLDSTRLT